MFEVALHLNDTVERISYKSPAEKRLVAAQNRSQQVALKALSAKEAKSIDALFNAIDNTQDTVTHPNGEKMPLSSIKSQLSGVETEGVLYFKEQGNKIFFKYYVKNKGDYLVTIFLNLDHAMTYHLMVE